jgi:hypothetical protein
MSALLWCGLCGSPDECECNGEPGQQPEPSVFDVLSTKPAASVLGWSSPAEALAAFDRAMDRVRRRD